jgi:heme A synthase
MVISVSHAPERVPDPGSGEGIRRLGNFQTAIDVHVRATAAFGIMLLLLLGYLWRNRERTRGLLYATLVVLALVLVQMAVGETQYRTQLPWWLVLVHVTVASTVWAATTAVVASFFRPVAGLARRV